MSTSTDAVIDSDSPRSSRNVGNGRMSSDSRQNTASASPTSVPGSSRRNPPPERTATAAAIPQAAALLCGGTATPACV